MKKEMMKNEPKGYGAKVEMKGNPVASDNKGKKEGTVKSVAMSGGKMEGSCYDHQRKSMQD